jgi:hypothetical protein
MKKPSLPINDQDLSSILDYFRRDILLKLNCHAIGEIDSFDPAKQTATVRISYLRTIYKQGQNGVQTKTTQAYPLIAECPVVSLFGSTSGLTMPIKPNDQCLVLFNDRDIDNWLNGLKNAEVASPRLHNLTDAFALVGIRSLDRVITNYDADNPVLFNGSTKITLKTAKVRIENNQFQLGAILDELVQALIDAQVAVIATGGAPSPFAPATITALNMAKTKLGGLLE